MEKLKDTVLKFLKLDHLIDSISGYVETRIELLKFEIREDVAGVLASGLVYSTILLFFFLVLLFLSMGLAHYLNTVIDSNFGGYWIVAGIYIVGTVVFITLRKNVERVFERYFQDVMTRKKKGKEEDKDDNS